MKRTEFITALDSLLEIQGVNDYCPNGLQVEGGDEIERVVTGVTASLEMIERAAEVGAPDELAQRPRGIFAALVAEPAGAGEGGTR